MTKKLITASAPGKIHFLGEHTAVYGRPALLAAIDKRCEVMLEPTDGAVFTVTSKNFGKTIHLSLNEILAIRDDAQSQWERYRETNDLSILRGIVRNEIMYPVVAIGETLRYFNKTSVNGFHLTIDSEIPVGSGHGSSAAVAGSVVAAVAAFLGVKADREVISAIAILVEQKKHGNPSYGDVGAVVNGGFIWFQKKTPEDIIVKPVDLSVPESLSKKLLVIQSGIPEESTGEMVHHVAAFKKQNPHVFDTVLNDQEQLTHALLETLKNADEEQLMRIIKKGQKNLETIGVVSSSAQKMINELEKAGGAAKICGAGGITKGSGIILAYHSNKNKLKSLAKTNQLPYYTVALGGAGLLIE